MSEAELSTGINLVLRYAKGIFPTQVHVKWLSDLRQLLNETKDGDYETDGFNWLTSAVFLVCSGNLRKSRNVLERLQGSIVVGPWTTSDEKFKNSFQATLKRILKERLPYLKAVLRLSGCTLLPICLRWIRECFFNILCFSDLCMYLSSLITLGPDTSLYLCVAILTHSADRIMKTYYWDERCTLQRFLNDNHHIGQGFSFLTHLPLIIELQLKYREYFMSILQER